MRVIYIKEEKQANLFLFLLFLIFIICLARILIIFGYILTLY
jgi:hypothetical protein